MSAVLQINNLTKVYGNSFAVEDFSMTLNGNEIVGLIGRNGSGKTTILKAICRYIFPEEGEILYQGQLIEKNPQLIRDYGIILEPSYYNNLSAEDNLRLLYWASCPENCKDRKAIVDTILYSVGLFNSRRQKVRNYSVQMKQKLAICQCLLKKPKLYILDEPFAGLDEESSKMFREFLLKKAHEEEIPILLTSNDIDAVVDICDRIVMIEDGKKVLDDPVLRKSSFIYRISEPLTDEARNRIQQIHDEILIINDDMLAFHNPTFEKKIQKCLTDHGFWVKDIHIQQNSLYGY